MLRIGHRERFAIEIGDTQSSPNLRRVDVFASHVWLTCDDNVVFLPTFIGALQVDLERLIEDRTPSPDTMPFPSMTPSENHQRLLEMAKEDNDPHLFHRFMNWGPTADNISMHLFRIDKTAFLPFSFWRPTHHDRSQLGKVFCAELPYSELASILHQAAWRLMWDWCERPDEDRNS